MTATLYESEASPLMIHEVGAANFARWTARSTGVALFEEKGLPTTSPVYSVLGAHNNNGADAGTLAHFATKSQLLFGGGGLTWEHTVSVRLTRGNEDAGCLIGPATAIHPGVGASPGNSYWAHAYNDAGTPKIGLGYWLNAGRVQPAQVNHTVREGDVLSLTYKEDPSDVTITALVNGVEVLSYVDTAGTRYKFSTLADPRIGITSQFHQTQARATTVYPETISQFFVTRGVGALTIPAATHSAHVGATRVHFMRKRHLASDPPLKTRWILGKDIVAMDFSFRRNGGCSSGSISLSPEQWNLPLTAAPIEKWAQEPYPSDLDNEDWLGGLVRIHCRYAAFPITTASTGNVDETVWVGRIRNVSYDRAKRQIRFSLEGLSAALRERRVTIQQPNMSIRDAVTEIVTQSILRTNTNEGVVDVINITGIQSTLDQRLDVNYVDTVAHDALLQLLQLLPDGMVWGIAPRAGQIEFYLQQSVDPHGVTIMTDDKRVPSYDMDRALSFERRVDPGDVENDVTVFGRDYDETDEPLHPSGKVTASASSERSIAWYGRRQKTVTNGNVEDEGLAAKYAAAIARRTSHPTLRFTLKVLQEFAGVDTFWHALVPFHPFVHVRETFDPDSLTVTMHDVQLPTGSSYKVIDRITRRYGDLPGYALKLQGENGGGVNFRSVSGEWLAQKSWLVHACLRFSRAHPGGTNTWAFIFGRPRGGGSANNRKGWGGLYWYEGTGALEWWYEDTGGTLRGPINTGITVSPSAPGNAIVRITVHRDSAGSWHFWNGATKTAGPVAGAQDPRVLTDDWRIFDSSQSGGGIDEKWGGELDQFWFYDTAKMEAAGGLTVNTFVGKADDRRLPRMLGEGCLRYAPFNWTHYAPAAYEVPHFARGTPTADPEAIQATWTNGSPAETDDAAPVTTATRSRRGFRIGESSSNNPAGESFKKWGGPLLAAIESVRYKIHERIGVVETDFELGDFANRFVQSLASIQREIQQQSELLRRIRE